MEVTVTKRFLLILAVLLVCICLPAWAEETGEEPVPSAVSEESAASVPENDTQDTSPQDDVYVIVQEPAQEALEGQPAQDEPAMESSESQPQQDEPAMESSESQPQQDEPEADPAEETPAQTHTDGHPTHEVQAGEAVYKSMNDPEMHRVLRRFDLYCDTCHRVVQENKRTEETAEPHAFALVSSVASTCVQEGSQTFVCSLCGDQRMELLPKAEHAWTDWEETSDPDVPVCLRERVLTRRCAVCGLEETNVIPASGHQWVPVTYTEATCCEDGEAVRRCAVCGEEETIVLPAFGHTYVQSNNPDTLGQYVCAICGELKEETGQTKQSHMYYNNTVTSFGPTTRELIGGSVWNRVTPVDLSQEGVFTYPLVASNQYTVGTATLVNGEDGQQVNYKLSSSKINVHSESLVVYPNLEALKTGEHAVSFDFNKPIDLKSFFGKDARVIVAITLKADYDADGAGVRRFSADQNWIDQMMEMIK